jgi:hypothetical protein
MSLEEWKTKEDERQEEKKRGDKNK